MRGLLARIGLIGPHDKLMGQTLGGPALWAFCADASLEVL